MFTKQPEGVKTYAKYDKPYPDEVADLNHEQFLAQTQRSPEPLNFKHILNIRRVRSNYINTEDNDQLEDKQEQKEGMKPREYLVWDLSWHRTDALGNYHNSYQPNLGIIPRLQPVTKIRKDVNGWEEKFIASTTILGKAYTHLYTGKESVKKLIQELGGPGCIRDLSTEEGRRKAIQNQMERQKWAAKNNKVVYQPQENEYIHFTLKEEGNRGGQPVVNFNDFCNGDFDDLIKFGHISTDEERKNRLAAEEVAKAQRAVFSASATDTNITNELDRAKERAVSGVPYK